MCCALFDVRRSVCVVCCVLLDDWCFLVVVLFVVCRALLAVRCVLLVVRYVLFVVGCLVFAVCCSLFRGCR